MKSTYRSLDRGVLLMGSLLAFIAVSAHVHADPTPPITPPTNPTKTPSAPAKGLTDEQSAELSKQLEILRGKGGKLNESPKNLGKLLDNMTLEYNGAAAPSTEVLNAKATVQLKSASFLSILEAVMESSEKTCRIECRQIHPLRVSVNVKDAPVAGLLDSLAKLSGARLYVLPSKLIIAPGTALTDDEKKKVNLYGVLISATTLPENPGAGALTVPDTEKKQKKSILDFANTKISVSVTDYPIGGLIRGALGRGARMDGHYGTATSGPIMLSDFTAPVSLSFQDVKYGDALASLAHLLDCELYITPKHFFVCRRNSFPATPDPMHNEQNTFAAFVPFSNSSAPSAPGA